MRDKFYVDKDQLQYMIQQNLTYEQIGDILGTTSSVIANRAKEYGIRTKVGPRSRFDIDTETLKEYLSMHMTYAQMSEDWEKRTGKRWSPYTIMLNANKQGLHSDARKYAMRADNPAIHEDVKQKISETVSKLWNEGYYEDRGVGLFEGSPQDYRRKARFYHPNNMCYCCGKRVDDNKIEIHHVDRDRSHNHLSNLMPVCTVCHKKYHRKDQFVATITKSFKFDSCHYLPYHDGKCKQLHGHTYHMEISIKNVVLKETGMVMDFSKFKKIVEEDVINLLDHDILNKYVKYPTAEFLVFWIWRKLSLHIKGLSKIKLWETDGSFSEITAEDYLNNMKYLESSWNTSNRADMFDEFVDDEQDGRDEDQ